MLVVDVETTGIDEKKHSIVSIGALYLFAPDNQFYQEARIWPGAEITDKALEINGFTREQITDPTKPSQKQMLEQFIGWSSQFNDLTLAGENPRFDLNFLNESFKREGLDFNLGYRTVDLHSILYRELLIHDTPRVLKKKVSAMNGNFIFNYVGLPKEPEPHNALTGAKFEAEAFYRLIIRDYLLEEFEKYPIPKHLLYKPSK
nr:hypothetical protein [Nanoarchaeum sp.]